MRRLIVEEPVTRAAPWALRCGWFAVAVVAIALLLVRDPRAETGPALAALGAGIAVALLAVALALGAFVRVWNEGARGLRTALGGLFLAALVLAYPGYMAVRGAVLPRLTDIATDVADPPSYSRSRAAYAARGGALPPEIPPAARALQREAYPQIAPLTLDLGPNEAFALALKAAGNRKWQVIEAIKPGGRVGNGRIEAVVRSRLLGLPYDVTVRVRPRADGARIDVRSASRYGDRDFGQNADHIRSYLEELSNLALAVK
ncbi:conserved hypothetical protein [Methylobacterium sp. 4-46]|uniref:DUF1499 domain-containing protein n=1 Tax=unclassified Methylobacterium TaxID=2615210 RepID=UPI000165C7A0|nr:MULTISPECIES: DUF1499 domain-containing protein [Methylobacterium]ACA17171.1 conserved hypothetical protein [Methylobacterium sp. 4-46]WFT82855.1 DUF1499 domain-containing protein [Methylobacterium nodulans]